MSEPQNARKGWMVNVGVRVPITVRHKLEDLARLAGKTVSAYVADVLMRHVADAEKRIK